MKKDTPSAELQTSATPALPADQAGEAAVQVPPLPATFEEPAAGGSYLRDPVTGALTLNTPKE